MLHRQSPFVTTCFVVVSTLISVPSATRAEAVSGVVQSAPVDQAMVRKAIDGITVKLREDYVFPDRGAQAAEALEKALAENAYAGVTDPSKFALQLTEQLRAITKDSHMRVIFGSPFGNQPPPSGP